MTDQYTRGYEDGARASEIAKIIWSAYVVIGPGPRPDVGDEPVDWVNDAAQRIAALPLPTPAAGADERTSLLRELQPMICSWLCPSTRLVSEGWSHVWLCREATRLGADAAWKDTHSVPADSKRPATSGYPELSPYPSERSGGEKEPVSNPAVSTSPQPPEGRLEFVRALPLPTPVAGAPVDASQPPYHWSDLPAIQFPPQPPARGQKEK